MAQGALTQGSRLDSEVGYGMAIGSRFVGNPRLGVSRSDYGRDYRVGYGLTALQGDGLQLELGGGADPADVRYLLPPPGCGMVALRPVHRLPNALRFALVATVYQPTVARPPAGSPAAVRPRLAAG